MSNALYDIIKANQCPVECMNDDNSPASVETLNWLSSILNIYKGLDDSLGSIYESLPYESNEIVVASIESSKSMIIGEFNVLRFDKLNLNIILQTASRWSIETYKNDLKELYDSRPPQHESIGLTRSIDTFLNNQIYVLGSGVIAAYDDHGERLTLTMIVEKSNQTMQQLMTIPGSIQYSTDFFYYENIPEIFPIQDAAIGCIIDNQYPYTIERCDSPAQAATIRK